LDSGFHSLTKINFGKELKRLLRERVSDGRDHRGEKAWVGISTIKPRPEMEKLTA
jgi:hypothetical protein